MGNIKVGSLVRIDVEVMAGSYWEDMDRDMIRYIQRNTGKTYTVKEINDNGDITLDDDVLEVTSFSDVELIVMEKVEVSILGEIENGEKLYSVAIYPLGEDFPSYVEFGFPTLEDVEFHVSEMTDIEIIETEIIETEIN